MIQNKKQSLIVIGAFILIIVLGTVTYAFFNYTRTGTANVIKTGRISFNSTQGNTINLTNMFPIEANETNLADSTKVGTVTINVTGDTTYTEGIEYLVTATNVQNTVGNKALPISVDVSYSANTNKTIGTEDEEYFDNRGGNSSLYRILAKDTITNNEKIVVGYIKPDQTGIDGNIVIKAYLDKAKVAISDTYPEEETDTNNDGYIDGTPNNFGTGRTIFTTTEWNSLQQNGVSFQIKVESNEGIWVEEEFSVNVMNTFPTVITSEKTNIKEIYFNKMGATRMQQAYDAATIKADLTYNNEGKVLAWLETNQDDNTKYNLIVASDGETYLTTGNYLFGNLNYASKIEFNNINTSRVTDMSYMFYSQQNLTELDVRSFDTSNVTTTYNFVYHAPLITKIDMRGLDLRKTKYMTQMFSNNASLTEVLLSDVVTRDVEIMTDMFNGSNSITNINLDNFGGSNLIDISGLFGNGNSAFETISMKNFNFGNASMASLFSGLTNLESVDFTGANATNITSMSNMFYGDTSIEEIDLSMLSTPNITSMSSMFSGCTNLKKVNISGLGGNSLSSISSMFPNTIKEIKMSGFNFGTISNLSYYFNYFTSLESIDLSNAIISNISSTSYMFGNCSALTTITVSNTWNTDNITSSSGMFDGCTSIVGGNGTTYEESNPKDKTYAIIDGTNGQPGYLTDIADKPNS